MPANRTQRLIGRHADPLIRQALTESRVTMVNGPRQSGKTTLVRSIAEDLGATYRTLDDGPTLEAARADPATFVESPDPLIIDEVQRAGDPLLLAIKASVDGDSRPGRFLLTGSARFLTVPTLSESLAGRLRIIDLWPLSQGEMRGHREGFLERMLDAPESLLRSGAGSIREDILKAVCGGGFPPVLSMDEGARRRWYRDYIRAAVERDVKDMADIRKIAVLPKLVRLLAARTAQELNTNALARDLGVKWKTVADYLALIETAYLAFEVPAWSRNLTAKVVRHPKVYILDSGLGAGLLHCSAQALMRGHAATGQLVETFVVGELARQISWSDADLELGHFRDRDGAEVDAILEATDGRVIGIEVKASASVVPADFRGLTLLRERLGNNFAVGAILYAGRDALSFGDRLLALPISAMWES